MRPIFELSYLAERAGFEPAVHLSAYTRLAGEHLRPTRSSLRDRAMRDKFGPGYWLLAALEFSIFNSDLVLCSTCPIPILENFGTSCAGKISP